MIHGSTSFEQQTVAIAVQQMLKLSVSRDAEYVKIWQALSRSTSCCFLNAVDQPFSSLVPRGFVERSKMAAEHAAVFEWNFENTTELVSLLARDNWCY